MGITYVYHRSIYTTVSLWDDVMSMPMYVLTKELVAYPTTREIIGYLLVGGHHYTNENFVSGLISNTTLLISCVSIGRISTRSKVTALW